MAEQRTDEWHSKRCGKITGSRFADVLAKSKRDGKPLKARKDLIWALAAERIQGYQPDSATSYAMKWGVDNEPLAQEAYEIKTGEFVESIDFLQHKDHEFIGVSPDGLIGDNGGIEIKCPKSPEIHLQRFIDGVPPEYMPQIQGCLWVTGRDYWDFVSYDPDTKEQFKLLIIRVEPNKAFIEKLESECLKVNEEVNKLVDLLTQKAA